MKLGRTLGKIVECILVIAGILAILYFAGGPSHGGF